MTLSRFRKTNASQHLIKEVISSGFTDILISWCIPINSAMGMGLLAYQSHASQFQHELMGNVYWQGIRMRAHALFDRLVVCDPSASFSKGHLELHPRVWEIKVNAQVHTIAPKTLENLSFCSELYQNPSWAFAQVSCIVGSFLCLWESVCVFVLI